MADMADLDSVEAAWADLGEVIDTDDLMPVTYINSTADLKAFCGRHGGIVCTSSNARAVLEWAFAQPPAGPLLPRPAPRPQHRPGDGHPARPDGRLGSPRAAGRQHARGDSRRAGSCSGRGIARSTRCSSPAHVAQFRQPVSRDQGPGPSRMHDGGRRRGRPRRLDRVHPQDDRGGPAGSTWAIGTELHLVNRLAAEHPDKTIHFLSPMVCMCATMYRIDLPHLAWCLENLAQGTPVNRIKVDGRDGPLGPRRPRADARPRDDRARVAAIEGCHARGIAAQPPRPRGPASSRTLLFSRLPRFAIVPPRAGGPLCGLAENPGWPWLLGCIRRWGAPSMGADHADAVDLTHRETDLD